MNLPFTFLILTIILSKSQLTPTFSTKTSYRRFHEENDRNIRPLLPHSLRFHYFYGLFRHGNRFWSEKWSSYIEETLKKIKDLSSFDIGNYSREMKLLNINTESSLNIVGSYYMHQIGVRFGKRIPDLKNVTMNNIQFYSTYKSRAFHSMSMFGLGLTDGRFITNQKIIPKEDPNFLRFFDVCSAYLQSKSKSKKIVEEFLKNKMFTDLVTTIASKLSIANVTNFGINDVLNLYELCAMCHAQYHHEAKNCPCELFDEEDLELLEYANDMTLFYQKGDGESINIEMAVDHSNHVVDMLAKMANSCSNDQLSPKMDAFFAHAETLLPVIANFGLLNNTQGGTLLDLNLTPHNFERLKGKKRLFRGSELVPFCGNFALVLACPTRPVVQFEDRENSNEITKPVVVAMLHEKNIPLECCESRKLLENDKIHACEIDKFIECYKTAKDTKTACESD